MIMVQIKKSDKISSKGFLHIHSSTIIESFVEEITKRTKIECKSNSFCGST